MIDESIEAIASEEDVVVCDHCSCELHPDEVQQGMGYDTLCEDCYLFLLERSTR